MCRLVLTKLDKCKYDLVRTRYIQGHRHTLYIPVRCSSQVSRCLSTAFSSTTGSTCAPAGPDGARCACTHQGVRSSEAGRRRMPRSVPIQERTARLNAGRFPSESTAGSCCGPKKLLAGQGPAVHFAGVTIVSVTGTQVRDVHVSVARQAAAARITVAMLEAGSVQSHKRGAGWRGLVQPGRLGTSTTSSRMLAGGQWCAARRILSNLKAAAHR